MHPDRTHPSPDQLAAFDAGRQQPGDREAVERHVAECPTCCRFLERLPEDALAARIREYAGRSTAGASETPPFESGAAAAGLADGLRGHPRYRVLGLLGAGGMGTVFRAVQTSLDRVVAIKVLHRHLTGRPGFAERFAGEVKALARLNHPNVVAAYDGDRAGDLHFLVMEFVGGESLEAVVARRGPLPAGEACGLVRQAAAGLQHAHEQGLVHRDVKPANLLLTPAGLVKVADFGLARVLETPTAADPGSAPLVLGTPEYMAPEQAREPNRADARSDLYSLGCTLYFLLAGRPPFLGSSRLQTLLDHQDSPAPRIASLPPAVAKALDRLLAKKPEDRFSTPAEAAEALRLSVGAGGTSIPPPRTSRRMLWPVAAVIAVIAVIAGAVLVSGPRDRPWQPGEPPSPNAPVESAPPAPEVAPMPRAVDRAPLASAEQLAALRKEAAERAAEWVRVNNRWRPDADIAVKTAARLTEAPPKVDEFVLTFGAGLLKSGRPVLVSARPGSFFVFELTPGQAEGANLGPMGHVFATYSHAPDARRLPPGVRLSDLRIAGADDHPPGERIDGELTCEFPAPPRPGDHLRVTHFRADGRRVMFLHHPKELPAAGRAAIRFSANPLEQRAGKGERLVIVFAEWVSEGGPSGIVESNTVAALVLVRPRP
jgi:hypothetical protein